MTANEKTCASQSADDTHDSSACAPTLDSTHPAHDTQFKCGAVTNLAGNQHHDDTHTASVSGVAVVGADETTHGAIPRENTSRLAYPIADPMLFTLAQTLQDYETLRIAEEHRLRIFSTPSDVPDEDGVCRGFGYAEDSDEVQVVKGLIDPLKDLEHRTVLSLQKRMRVNPIWPYFKDVKGVGEKTLARLMACIGDPYLRPLDDGSYTPRTVSQLWAYCGMHTIANKDGEIIAAKRMKGVQANWNTEAKTRLFLLSQGLLRQGIRKDKDGNQFAVTPYGQLYLDRRAHTAVTHPEWNPGHGLNDALRIMGKELLKQLWRAAREIHTGIPMDVDTSKVNELEETA